jgi:hypothetical protein
MIAIINRGPHTGDSGGEHNYDVRIGDELIAQFKHKRSDGLATCLRKAADAGEQKQERLIRAISELAKEELRKRL